MNQTTIYALSTPEGTGAIGLIRLSGPATAHIAMQVTGKKFDASNANKAMYCTIKKDEQVIDDVLATFFKGPKSFTGEDTLEIGCHGSRYIIAQIMKLLGSNGAVPAQPGEFTMRAFLNGKMDLSQAEAVADLIASESEAAHGIAMHQMRGGFSGEIKFLREELINFASLIELELDFAEEDVEFADRGQLLELFEKINTSLTTLIRSFEYGNAIKNGIPVAIVGAPNAGKSTLLNALLNEDKAIVSAIPGTTRDVIEDTITLEGIHFRFIDTAGIRNDTTDEIEQMGIERSFAKIEQSQIIFYCVSAAVHDNTTENIEEALEKTALLRIKFPGKKIIAVATKADLAKHRNHKQVTYISAKTKDIRNLEKELLDYIHSTRISQNQVIVTNVRHLHALEKAHAALIAAKNGLLNNVSADLVAMDIRATLHFLGEITGTISTEDLLGNIFSKFCIGK